ncbi:MAG: 23S rRNA (uracil(1939)-C(5))-methyltransferase RlmD [Oscillospiraceae bacterium]|nr:23S rRNA (uracil(1939)-C(5))-methyltransferase RlmD [Oscillospiraceae bacterium]
MPLDKNQLHTVTIKGYASDGAGVARIDGQVVFVKGAMDGETCEIRILRVAKQMAWAKIETIISPSPQRITPVCPAFGPCGGCDFQHMTYEEELRLKRQRVIDALARVGDLDIPVGEIIAAERQDSYRNKAIFAVGQGADGTPVTGFYRRRSHQIFPVTACRIQGEAANCAATALREWMAAYDVAAYDEGSQTGIIRHLFVREARGMGKSAVCIVVTRADLPQTEALIAAIRRHCPTVSSIMLCVNQETGNVVLRGRFSTLWGDDHLVDTLAGLRFRLSPRSFFQVNPAQAERLYAKALDYADLTGAETVLDLYCGTGTITLIMAGRAKYAIGAEVVEQAVLDARENARINGIENAEFRLADAADITHLSPDVVVVDPPRKGLAEQVISQIAAMAPRRVVYVSCDPATLARDLARFTALGYRTREVTPVDMFPRCAHVECVAEIWRVGL